MSAKKHIFLFLLTFLYNISVVLSQNGVNDDTRYRAGREKYEMLKKESAMPKYSACWTKALNNLDSGCRHLTDDVQHRLALKFTNCFLMKTGRQTYECDDSEKVSVCTGDMKPEAYNTYTEFFTHTQNICFFLQSQTWQEETEATIDKLSENSATVARQIEDSSQLQSEVIKQQNESIRNQQLLIARGIELKTTLEESSVDVHHMIQEFKDSTSEQKVLIFEVFERLNSLQSIVMGEFTGFYSVVFYAVSVLVCYLLTSTPRTSSARFWLFVIMTVNIISERILVSIGGSQQEDPTTGNIVDESTIVYGRLWWCRKVFCTIAIALWIRFAYVYQDFNKINNQLLVEIRKQNSDLKHLLQGSSSNSKAVDNSLLDRAFDYTDTSLMNTTTSTELVAYDANKIRDKMFPTIKDSSTTGYESGDSLHSSENSFDSVLTDRTFTLMHEPSDTSESDTESFCTSASHDTTNTNLSALEEELRYLREATPMRELWGTGPLEALVTPSQTSSKATPSTPTGRRRGRPKGSKNKTTPIQVPVLPQTSHRYNLRSYHNGAPSISNPILRTESAHDFGHLVRQMAKISQRNKVKTQVTISRNTVPGAQFSSDDN